MKYKITKKNRTVTDTFIKLGKHQFDLREVVKTLDLLEDTAWGGNIVLIGNPHFQEFLEKKKIIATDRNRGGSWNENEKKRQKLYDEMFNLLYPEE